MKKRMEIFVKLLKKVLRNTHQMLMKRSLGSLLFRWIFNNFQELQDYNLDRRPINKRLSSLYHARYQQVYVGCSFLKKLNLKKRKKIKKKKKKGGFKQQLIFLLIAADSKRENSFSFTVILCQASCSPVNYVVFWHDGCEHSAPQNWKRTAYIHIFKHGLYDLTSCTIFLYCSPHALSHKAAFAFCT